MSSALVSRRQSKLVREFHCFFLPPPMTSLKDSGLLVKKTSPSSSESCQFDAGETEYVLKARETLWPPIYPERRGE